MPGIGADEFEKRIAGIQEAFDEAGIDAMLVYGDEYRRENLRYVSNFWPIFERAACIIPRTGKPMLGGAPEGEKYARESCVWQDIRNIREFACVSVPEEIDYPLADFSSLRDMLGESLGGGSRLGLVGRLDMPSPLLERVRGAVEGMQICDADRLLTEKRMIKSPAEIECLREAGRLACAGYGELMKASVPGNTERQAAAAAEGEARAAGAEDISFTVYGSGKRAETIIGRPSAKTIEDGDMIMAAFAVQYEGYVSTVEYPFVAGRAAEGQKRFLSVLFEAANEQRKHLRGGVPAAEMVRAVKNVFRKNGMSDYDVYPPMHGIGLAEAESPYPDLDSEYSLEPGMCVNSDISLFGHPDGSNRIEEGFLITEGEPESLTGLIRAMVAKGI